MKNTNMIVKELFNQVTFEELCPQLKFFVKSYDLFGDKLLMSIYRFREAYDRLKLIEPDKRVHEKIKVIVYDNPSAHIDLSCDLE